MYQFIATVLAWFYGLIHNYAFAISMLTVTVMVALTPLTLRSTKSMLEMQRIQPEVKRLQNEFKGDRQRLNEEVMKLYKEHKVNPLGGCLPLILQMPVFFVLYQVLRDLTRTCSNATQIELGECTVVGNFRPDHIAKTSDMFRDLAASDRMLAFGLDLSRTPVEQVQEGLATGAPYILLIIAMAGLSFFAQWQVSLRSKVTGQIINKQQQMIFRILPIGFAVISVNFPTGLIVYWIVQNIVRIIQNWYITRRFYGPHGPAAQLAAARVEDGKHTAQTTDAKADRPRHERTAKRDAAGPQHDKGKPSASPQRTGGSRPAPKGRPAAPSGNGSAKDEDTRPASSPPGAKAPKGKGRSGPPPKARPTPQPRGQSPRREP
jgi:YidC/Oxa1 family membrane protein insertase